jgi:hypothetical protein
MLYALSVQNRSVATQPPTSEELAQFKSESGFSEKEIKWVYHHLLTPSQQEKVNEAANANQLNLLSQTQALDWVRYQGDTFLVSRQDGQILFLRKSGSGKILHRVHINDVEIGGYRKT